MAERFSNKKKIIIHSTDSDSWDNNFFHISKMQRGILSAEEGDIVISPYPYDAAYLDYLRDVGILTGSVSIWSPHQLPKKPLNQFLCGEELKDFLKPFKDTHYVDAFLPGRQEKLLVENLGIDIFYNFEIAESFSDKGNFRNLLKRLKLPSLEGFEFLKNASEIKKSVEILFEKNIDEVIIKKSAGNGGKGNIKIKKNYFYSLGNSDRLALVENIFDYFNKRDAFPGTFIVEEFLNASSSSPSFQYICFPDRAYKLISVHDQLFFTEGHFLFQHEVFNGVKYPAAGHKTALESLEAQCCRVMDVMSAEHKFFGYSGFDAIINNLGNFLIDPNIRRQFNLYPFEIAKRIMTKDFSYIYYNYIMPNGVVGSFTDAYKIMGSLAFPVKDEKRGAIILSFFPYNKYSNLMNMMFIDSSAQGADSLKNAFELRLNKLLAEKWDVFS